MTKFKYFTRPFTTKLLTTMCVLSGLSVAMVNRLVMRSQVHNCPPHAL